MLTPGAESQAAHSSTTSSSSSSSSPSTSSTSASSSPPSPTPSSDQGQSGPKLWIIAVAAIGGIFLLALIGVIACIFIRRKRQAYPQAPTELQLVPSSNFAARRQDVKPELAAEERPMTGYSVNSPNGLGSLRSWEPSPVLHTKEFEPPQAVELPTGSYRGYHARYQELSG